MRVLFYYRGIENLGVGYCMSMLKSHGHEIDLIFDPGLDDNLFIKFPHLAWMNRHQELLERATKYRKDLRGLALAEYDNRYGTACQGCFASGALS